MISPIMSEPGLTVADRVQNFKHHEPKHKRTLLPAREEDIWEDIMFP